MFDDNKIATGVSSADAILEDILAAIKDQGSSAAQATGASAPGVLGGAVVTVSLPQIQLDILRQGIASEEEGYGDPSISSLVLTAPADGTASFTNAVGTNETWVLLAPLGVSSTVHDALLKITATLDVPTKLLIPPFPFMEDRDFKSTTLRAVKSSLGLTITNGTASSAQVNFVVEYAVVPSDYFTGVVVPLLKLGNRVYQNVAQAAKAQGLI